MTTKNKKRVNRILGYSVDEVTDQDIDELVDFSLQLVCRMISSSGFRTLIATASQIQKFF